MTSWITDRDGETVEVSADVSKAREREHATFMRALKKRKLTPEQEDAALQKHYQMASGWAYRT